MKIYKKKKILKVSDRGKRELEDDIALEMRLIIRINGKEVISLYCSPSMIRELVTGIIATEKIVEGEWCAERMSVEYGDEIIVDVPAEGAIMTPQGTRTSGCIGGLAFSDGIEYGTIKYQGRTEKDVLISLNNEFQKISEPYRLTGCIHSAALAGENRIIYHAEDIGRHNAVDKILGHCILENITMQDKIMLVSGRLSSEMVQKCARWKIPVVTSRTAPTLRAVELADRAGMTLVGFLRERRFNVYSHVERIST